ncbi:MAG: hypothetical protein IPG06_20815 [Haliea sp.]|nr:hypothetical protein [Haliea sp.]
MTLISSSSHRPYSAWLSVGYLVAGAIILFAAVRLGVIVINGSQLQYADYWLMIDSVIRPDGSVNVPGLFVFNNEHPLVIPKLIYWINIIFFAGANIPLGLFDIGIVFAQLFLVARMLGSSSLGQTERIATFILAGALLFGLTGSWNFLKSMSGAGWLTANFFALAAIYLRATNKCKSAFVLAILASMSYGTGVLTWPALLVVGITLRTPGNWWKEWPYLFGLLITVLWINSSSAGADRVADNNILEQAQVAAAQLGFSVTNSKILGALIGWIPLIGIPLLAPWLSLWAKRTQDACWIGLATFGWSSTVLIIYGRSEVLLISGPAARHHSIAAITWLGFAVLVLVTIRTLMAMHERRKGPESGPALHSQASLLPPVLAIILLTPVIFGAMTAGFKPTETLQNELWRHNFRAIALRLELVDDSLFMTDFSDKRFYSTKLLKDNNHYPFSDRWLGDCGLLGETMKEPADQQEVGQAGSGWRSRALRNTQVIRGVIPEDFLRQNSIKCIVVTDTAGKVVGVGQARAPTDEHKGSIFGALAPGGSKYYSVYVVSQKGDVVKLQGRILGYDFEPT